MTLDEARELFAYDSWANERVLESLEQQPQDALTRDLGTSHQSLLGTMVHLVAAQEIWLSRWKGAPRERLRGIDEVGDFPALRRYCTDIAGERDAFLNALSVDDLDREVSIATKSGGSYRHRLADMFRHVVNHSSYHRGQVVTLLRQLGATPPATDLIRYYREAGR